MSPTLLPWWGWLVTAAVLWLAVQFTDEDDSWLVRGALVVGMVLSALIGIIRFVKWIWDG